MGQKIRPDSLRLGIIRDWNSRWFARRNFKSQLEEDEVIRKIIKSKIAPAGIVRIEIERSSNNLFRIAIKAARPGLVIGRGGKGIEDLTGAIEIGLKELFGRRGVKNPKAALSLNVEELKRSEISAPYVAQSIAWDLERRMHGRRTMKKYLELALQNREVQGIKIKLSGRIDGAEISRREWLAKGKLPLQTLRANIDYGEGTAFTSFGTIGIKVWIYRGEVFAQDQKSGSQRNQRSPEAQ